MEWRGAQRRLQRIGFTALLAALAVAGCGGGSDEPTAGEKRKALDRWVTAADAACRNSNDAIAKRGWPLNLVDLDRLTVRAITEIREASDAVRKLRAPEGSEDRVRPFLASVERLEPVMEQLSSTTERFKPGRLNDILPKVQSSLSDAETQSKKLQLRECAANDEHVWVPDAIRAPVFAQQLGNLTRQITKRSKAVTSPASTQGQAARNLDRLSDVVADADAEFSERTLTMSELTAVRRKFFSAARLEAKRARKLLRAVGAVPVLPGGDGGEEEVPGGEGTEPA